MNDRLERYVEVILAGGGMGGAFYGAFNGYFNGFQAMVLVIASIALYQSTSIAKVVKNIDRG